MIESLRSVHFRLLLNNQGLLLAGVVLVTFASIFGLSRFQIDVSSRSFFPRDAPATAVLEEFRETFPSQENILLAVEFPDTVFSPEAIRHLKRLTKEIARMQGISSVWSLANVDTLAEHLVASGNTEGLRRYMIENPRYRSVLVSADGRSALLLISAPFDDTEPGENRKRVEHLRSYLRKLEGPDCRYHLSEIGRAHV